MTHKEAFGLKKETAFKNGILSIYHSAAYHKYFEGFAERKVVDPDNKVKIVRVYTEEYYIRDLSETKEFFLKLAYGGILSLIIFLFIFSASLKIEANTNKFINITQALSVAVLAAMTMSIIFYIISHGKLTIYNYRTSSLSFKRNAVIASCNFFLSTLCIVIYIFNNSDKALLPMILEASCMFSCALMFVLINIIENGINYKIILNKEGLGSDG
jgi:hypothetical protein